LQELSADDLEGNQAPCTTRTLVRIRRIAGDTNKVLLTVQDHPVSAISGHLNSNINESRRVILSRASRSHVAHGDSFTSEKEKKRLVLNDRVEHRWFPLFRWLFYTSLCQKASEIISDSEMMQGTKPTGLVEQSANLGRPDLGK